MMGIIAGGIALGVRGHWIPAVETFSADFTRWAIRVVIATFAPPVVAGLAYLVLRRTYIALLVPLAIEILMWHPW